MPYPKQPTIVLIALGHNRIQVPCRIFETKDQAERFCQKHFGDPIKEEPEKEWYTDHKLNTPVYLHPSKNPDPIFPGLNPIKKDTANLFTYFYGGCDTPWGYYIAEVPYDTPFIGWDPE
jgi:hypothetical protein